MVSKVLIANRGEIAVRIIRTLREMGIASVAVYSEADRHAAHVRLADEAVPIGPAPVSESYLNQDAILAACKSTGADAVHPGYGFLSENPGFAERLEAEGIRFIGPTPDQMRIFGLKHSARDAAEKSGVPLLPGSGLVASLEEAKAEAARIGYPVMLKSTAGGGGIGLQLCETDEDLPGLFDTVRRLAQSNFSDPGIFVEKYIDHARHVEVQIFGDGNGRVVSLGERDCSLQRRNQKVVEETPAPGLPAATRTALINAALSLGRSVDYRSAGTVEFIYDGQADAFYFLEVNTRLQVEHPVTEMVTGQDLVAWMVKQAAGELDLSVYPDILPTSGAAIEVRVYAEDPGKGFQPSTGPLTHVSFPDEIRVDTWIETGAEVSMYYDPMLAKIIVFGDTREAAADALLSAIDGSGIYGIETNLAYLSAIVGSDMFRSCDVDTKALDRFDFVPSTVDVLSSGTHSALQDWPGRAGYWHVGVPPSGPMDALNFRIANVLLGNHSRAAALEMTMAGPVLRFNTNTVIALTGADMQATLDGAPVPRFETTPVKQGQTLAFGKVVNGGIRSYLAVAGGFDAPVYLGSRATFDLGGFGGHATGNLKSGDVLRLNGKVPPAGFGRKLPGCHWPHLPEEWEIGVLYGPHGAPDFFTDEDIETLFSTAYEVHFNSARTGVRLIGPKPKWARPDGGEAGLHPSNIHDNAYAVGAIDFTGDMPIILGPDGPSLGGFTCPAVVAKAELWKVGQLRPGDRVRFHRLTLAEAEALESSQEGFLKAVSEGLDVTQSPPPTPTMLQVSGIREDAVLARDTTDGVDICYRRTGEDFMLVEFGEQELDLDLRVRAHLLMERVQAEGLDAVIDLTPGIRSLQVHFDNRRLKPANMLALLRQFQEDLPPLGDVRLPSRVVHMPLSWDDESTRIATKRYQDLVRPDAPWCPWNIEFIRRINGLESVEDVKKIVFDADYMVLGLGDVYLGAPVATPVDPRHRLVTTKYNPARTWTPQNAVGIGGAYMCVYGMEGPGGYQFVGRTVQVWNTHRQTGNFKDGKPWLLRFFDRIKFYPVGHEELAEMRDGFLHGEASLKIEDGVFDLGEYHRFRADNADAISSFREMRQNAFSEERARWEAQGIAAVVDETAIEPEPVGVDLPDGAALIEAPMNGSVWKVSVEIGDRIATGDKVAVLEAMKTEIGVDSPQNGYITDILCKPGQIVRPGDPLLVIQTEA
ncbi:urea carboxylase [Hwanghaeella grinnelliae]|uniref:Urea carboxylase n=1 Tax=Hwanghaeella grinnelliae TaxID=2500179 RepID=A0A3S2VTS8_9PROT|nr:urea carboxylase [Hwanghaeella grinnelliae]RVU39654.1 urea carboxylase [Hwanghaeella grinnelliae]